MTDENVNIEPEQAETTYSEHIEGDDFDPTEDGGAEQAETTYSKFIEGEEKPGDN